MPQPRLGTLRGNTRGASLIRSVPTAETDARNNLPPAVPYVRKETGMTDAEVKARTAAARRAAAMGIVRRQLARVAAHSLAGTVDGPTLDDALYEIMALFDDQAGPVS